jgi:hypothetical protein
VQFDKEAELTNNGTNRVRTPRAAGVHWSPPHFPGPVPERAPRRGSAGFWTLIAIGLTLAVSLVVVLETWPVLPPAVQMGAFLFSIVLVLVALSRLLAPNGSGSHHCSEDHLSDPNSSMEAPLDTIDMQSKFNDLPPSRVA